MGNDRFQFKISTLLGLTYAAAILTAFALYVVPRWYAAVSVAKALWYGP